MRFSLRQVSGVLCFCLLLSSSGLALSGAAAEEPSFTDVVPNSSPYAEAIYELAKLGIVHGYNDGTGRFGPLDPVLRGQAAAVVVRTLGWSGEHGQSGFSDRGPLDDELWNSVCVLADHGVARGFGDGTYRPLDQVAQAQIISLITRSMVNSGDWQQADDNPALYPDLPAASGARVDVITYQANTGGNPFATSSGAGGWSTWSALANRQEVALVVWNALKTRRPKPSASTSPSSSPSNKPSSSPSGIPSSSPSTTPSSSPSTSPGTPAPVAGQPCPAWVHDRYVATGPDGKSYPTWHPPVDPQSGCFFGHEHGADPTGSPALKGRPVLFGYAGAYSGLTEAPHTGFKVFRYDNIAGENAPTQRGSSVLFVVHMGTSGAGRFTTVYHETTMHYVNPDGREAHVTVMAPFGTLKVGQGCGPTTLEATIVQASIPGFRNIPGERCVTTPNTLAYETWPTELYLGVDQFGQWKAHLQVSFAVFGPNTYCILSGTTCGLGYTDTAFHTGQDPASTSAFYKGTKRHIYLNPMSFRNSGGATSIWTDAFGKTVSSTTPGAIQQYISAVNITPNEDSQALGVEDDFDAPGVHAPN